MYQEKFAQIFHKQNDHLKYIQYVFELRNIFKKLICGIKSNVINIFDYHITIQKKILYSKYN
jgi:hypothetical protein